MSKPAKKDLEKRRKERDRKRLGVSERAQAAGITPFVERFLPLPAPHVDFPVSPTETWTVQSESTTGDWAKEVLAASKPQRPPPREKTEEEKQIDRWWRLALLSVPRTLRDVDRQMTPSSDEMQSIYLDNTLREVLARVPLPDAQIAQRPCLTLLRNDPRLEPAVFGEMVFWQTLDRSGAFGGGGQVDSESTSGSSSLAEVGTIDSRNRHWYVGDSRRRVS